MSPRKCLWQLSFRVNAEREEEARTEVYALTGANPASHARPDDKRVRVDVYLDNNQKARTARRQLAHRRPTVRKLPYENWAETWKKHFPIQRIGKRMVIKPTWKKYRARPGEIVIELDPGLSFGTGQHPTTRFCLRMIERLFTHPLNARVKRATGTPDTRVRVAGHGDAGVLRLHATQMPLNFLDIGTGSGILAIAAAKLGYRPVHAVDNDSQAIRVARANFRNNVGGGLRRATFRAASLHDLRATTKVAVVAANLLADLILARRRKLSSLVAPGGFLILAGILVSEARDVERAFRRLGLKTFACERNRNWAGFVFHEPKKGIAREKDRRHR